MTNEGERGMTKAEPTKRFPYKAQSRQQVQNHSELGLHHLVVAFEEKQTFECIFLTKTKDPNI